MQCAHAKDVIQLRNRSAAAAAYLSSCKHGVAGFAGLFCSMLTSVWPQIIGFDVINTWEYPGQELQIKHVSMSSYPDLFYALQASCT